MTDERPRRSDATRAAILRAAKERFAADGYERATIRAIAADAAIDPSMVMRYYGSKERLFAAAAEFDLRLPELSGTPAAEVASMLLTHFLERWEDDETLTALLRASVTNQAAADRMREIFTAQLVPVVEQLHTDQPRVRAGLVASQILGLALCRYVLALAPMATMSRPETIAWIAPTVQRYLLGPYPADVTAG
ncbi:TetR family transcriptional regulator [Paractinoplanes ferrugineus]|uniref:TetR family transcriptional regulator n=1 Tax=Paractinoplanes ferrugineus TaxID=113564 RepID=A0A919MB50_9ACTN|nr:TetR/AcrR family transcriptional regulator [Actinoplanes ferrugineus]GIE13291.1 TetR family transcriptional regulator [Actinoplanes ferrugineus]